MATARRGFEGHETDRKSPGGPKWLFLGRRRSFLHRAFKSNGEVQPALDPDAVAIDGAASTTGQTVLSGGAWHGLGLVLPQLYTVFVSVVAARLLGPDDLGRQSFIAFVEISAIMLVTGGVGRALIRCTGEAVGRGEAEAVRSLVTWALRVTLGAATAGALALVAFAVARPPLRSAWLLAAAVVVLGALHSVPTAVLIGLQRWRQATVAGLVTGVIGTATTLTVLALGGGIVGMFAVELALAGVNLAWMGGLALRALRSMTPHGRRASDLHRRMVRYTGLFSIDVVFSFVVWSRTEFFFLERYGGPRQIAIYSISYAAVVALTKIPDAIVGALNPAIATLFGADALERISSGFSRAVRLVTTVTLPMTAGVLAFGPAAIGLVYGPRFQAAGGVLMTMMIVFPAVALGRMCSSLLSGIGVVSFILVTSVVAATLNIGLDLALIDDHGPVGAAVANGAAQLAMSVALLVYASRRVNGIVWNARHLMRTAVASAASGLAARWVLTAIGGVAGFSLAIAVAILVFVPLAVGMRILSEEDARWLEGVVGARVHGLAGSACRQLARVARSTSRP